MSIITHPEAVRLIHEAAADFIDGYGAVSAVMADTRRRDDVLSSLFTDGTAPPAEIVIAVSDATGHSLYGAAIVEAFVSDDLVRDEPDTARSMARLHFVLAGMFVDPEARGEGIGSALLYEAVYQVIAHGGRFLDGFVDDRNGSVRFYHRAGATVRAHNHGLPARPPANVALKHPAGFDGHWFYLDGWARFHSLINCARCRQPLTFHPEDGGSLSCNRCGPPPTAERDAA